MSERPQPELSLILATRNRAAGLRELLAALGAQSPELDWELVVVDNGSTDGTSDWLRAQAFERPMSVLSEPQPGKSRALNLGIAHARGRLLAFTDDDVTPATGWLAAFVSAAARHPSANVFGGRIVPDPRLVPGWIAASQNLQQMLLSEHDLGAVECVYPPYRYPIGPSMAVRASAVERAHARWPVNRGPGTRLPLGDERGFLQQVSAGPATDRLYVPDAEVRHAPEPEQLVLAAALERCFKGGFVAGRFDAAVGRRVQLDGATRRTVANRLRPSSARELACVLTRAAGVLAGRLTGAAGRSVE